MFSSHMTSFCNSLSAAFVTAGVGTAGVVTAGVVTAGVVTAGVVMAGTIVLPKGGVSTLPNGGDNTGLVACTELFGGAILGAWIVAPAANEDGVDDEVALFHASSASISASFVEAEAM